MKIKKVIVLILFILTTSFFLTGCGKTNDIINVYTRDTTSGTREGFFSAIDAKDAKSTNAYLVKDVYEVSGNGDMIYKIINDKNGIGYISLPSLDTNKVNALTFNGVAATNDNVLNDSYKLSRTFAYATITDNNTGATNEQKIMVNEFNRFLTTLDAYDTLRGASVIVDEKDFTGSYEPSEEVLNIKNEVLINVGGSSSVEAAAKALTNALSAKLPTFKAIHAHTGSGDSKKVVQGTDMQIGFSSSGKRSDWDEAVENETVLEDDLGKDAIVMIVNKKNNVTDVTTANLQQIYIRYGAKHDGELIADMPGNIKRWSLLK